MSDYAGMMRDGEKILNDMRARGIIRQTRTVYVNTAGEEFDSVSEAIEGTPVANYEAILDGRNLIGYKKP